MVRVRVRGADRKRQAGAYGGPAHFPGVTVQALLSEVTCRAQARADDSLNINDGALTVAVQISGATGCISERLVGG